MKNITKKSNGDRLKYPNQISYLDEILAQYNKKDIEEFRKKKYYHPEDLLPENYNMASPLQMCLEVKAFKVFEILLEFCLDQKDSQFYKIDIMRLLPDIL